MIQILRKKSEEKKPSPILNLEERIISDCYEEFTRKHWEKIIKKLDVREETFNEAIAEITKLNPRPGASLGETIGRNLQQIVPDFLVDTYDDGTINVSLNNRNVPELRMSRDFTEMVEEHTKNRANQSKESKEAMMFLKQKMDAAQGFIDAVRQRQNTLMTTMQAIIDLQRPFFLEGDESLLKPMILLTTITSTNGTLQLFDESLNLTNGGPGKSTMTMSHYIYNMSFVQSPNFGYAAAMSILILIMVAILALLQMKVGDER